MATVYTAAEPTNPGELRVYRSLAPLADDSLHLWFDLSISCVNQIDVLLYLEHVGLFIIEVKDTKLDSIERFSSEQVTRRGGSVPERSPVKQALAAGWTLIDYLKPLLGARRCPTFVPVPCFPRIRREEWKVRFRENKVIAEMAESFLLEDDLSQGAATLRARLEAIWKRPAAGAPKSILTGPWNGRTAIQKMAEFLLPQAAPKPTVRDAERMRALEDGITRQTINECPPFGGRSLIYSGLPGTGKTFRLLQIGMLHANNGANVLFTCFNKVLAADLRRLLGLYKLQIQTALITEDERRNSPDTRLVVQDIFQLALSLQATFSGLIDHPSAFVTSAVDRLDRWGEDLVLVLKENPDLFPLEKFDTILVDEGQDILRWQHELLQLHAAKRATTVVANGSGQELYLKNADAARWLDDLAKAGAKQVKLRRNFRNAAQVFKVAYCFAEAAFSDSKLASAAQTVSKNSPVDLDGVSGLLRVQSLDERKLDFNSPAINDDTAHLLAAIVENELDNLAEREEPIDLLILVPDRSSVAMNQMKLALSIVKQRRKVEYIDYTDDGMRRCIPPNEKIRLCTFHSSRGLEAARVLIYGIERIEDLAEKVDADFRKLGFIILSRAKADTLVIRRSFDAQAAPFVEKSIVALNSITSSSA